MTLKANYSKDKKKKKTDKEMLKSVSENTCIHCGNIMDENLKKWFSDRWVNIGKKKKGGGHPPCGTSGKKEIAVKNAARYPKATNSITVV